MVEIRNLDLVDVRALLMRIADRLDATQSSRDGDMSAEEAFRDAIVEVAEAIRGVLREDQGSIKSTMPSAK